MIKIPALIYLLTGSFLALILFVYFPFYLNWKLAIIVIFTAIICFLYQRFFCLGIVLAVISIWLNTSPPYQQVFINCHYQADILQANHNKLWDKISLYAKNIDCDGQNLANQKVLFWDNNKQFKDLENYSLTINSQLQPIKKNLNLETFDYEKMLIADGIRLLVKQPNIINKYNQNNPILILRNKFTTAITKNLSPNNSAIILALITGNRSALSIQQKQTLQQTGTRHILAISGLHLALIGGIAWLLGQWFWAMSWKLSDKIMPIQAGAVLAFIAISIYALLTGFDIPIKRAWIMFSLFIFSWLQLKSLSINTLLFAAIIVLLVDPYAVVSVGFYFSFIATFIVLWSAKLPYPAFIKIIIMQIIINLALLPITWAVFGNIPLTSLLVNLLIIPWLAIWVMPWAVLACLLNIISYKLEIPFWKILDTSTTVMWKTLQFFANLDFSLTPTFSPILIIVIISIICLLLVLITGKKLWILGFFLIFIPIKKNHYPSLIIADERYTSVLIDNGKIAIIINPGRKYQNINEAQKWHLYLQKRGLELGAIILQNDKISRISSTSWLLSNYPNAKIITLTNFINPFNSKYCQSFSASNLQLVTFDNGRKCQASIKWFGKIITLFYDQLSSNSIFSNSQLNWQNKSYSSQKLGAIIIKHKGENFNLSYLRENKRLWRLSVDAQPGL